MEIAAYENDCKISKRCDQCEVISKEVQEVKVQKRALESELAAFRWKETIFSGAKEVNLHVEMKLDMAIRLVPNIS